MLQDKANIRVPVGKHDALPIFAEGRIDIRWKASHCLGATFITTSSM
jgi:hypothetical protein